MRALLAFVCWSLIAGPALAAAFPNPGATDAMDASPIVGGTSLLDARFDAQLTRDSGSQSAFNLNFQSSVRDGLEVGGGLNVDPQVFGAPAGSAAFQNLYLFGRGNLPFATDTLRTALGAGTTLPVGGGEWQPGIAAMVDLVMGPLMGDVNLGYARGLASGTNWLAGNLNMTLEAGGLKWYEEQYVNLPVGGYPDGGLRISVIVALGDSLTVDLTPAALWSADAQGLHWTLNPNVGLDWAF